MNFSHQFMKDNCGCYGEERLMKCSFMSSEPVSLESIIKSEIPLKDKFWFFCKKVATKEQNQRLAIAVAEAVLGIFEKRYPDDKRPREAIEAAKKFIVGHISIDELRKKRSAAYAAADAYAAACAADAADAAAYAAADAYAAAYAAADAYAAACAACAADAAAADVKNQLIDILFKEIREPQPA